MFVLTFGFHYDITVMFTGQLVGGPFKYLLGKLMKMMFCTAGSNFLDYTLPKRQAETSSKQTSQYTMSGMRIGGMDDKKLLSG